MQIMTFVSLQSNYQIPPTINNNGKHSKVNNIHTGNSLLEKLKKSLNIETYTQLNYKNKKL